MFLKFCRNSGNFSAKFGPPNEDYSSTSTAKFTGCIAIENVKKFKIKFDSNPFLQPRQSVCRANDFLLPDGNIQPGKIMDFQDIVDHMRSEEKRQKADLEKKARALLKEKKTRGQMRSEKELEQVMNDIQSGKDAKKEAAARRRQAKVDAGEGEPIDFEGKTMELTEFAEKEIAAEIPCMREAIMEVNRDTQVMPWFISQVGSELKKPKRKVSVLARCWIGKFADSLRDQLRGQRCFTEGGGVVCYSLLEN